MEGVSGVKPQRGVAEPSARLGDLGVHRGKRNPSGRVRLLQEIDPLHRADLHHTASITASGLNPWLSDEL